MSAELLASTGFAVFLEGEQRSVARHELVGGRVYAKAGGSERHDLMAGLVYEALAPGARRAGCRPFTSNRLLRTEGAAYYPDVLIVCGPASHRLYESDAALVVEVLSPSTRDTDRREKSAAYAGLTSLQQYVLIDLDRRVLELATPQDGELDWSALGAGMVLDTPYGGLDVEELFSLVEASASTS